MYCCADYSSRPWACWQAIAGDLQVFDDGEVLPARSPAKCVVLVQKFDYDYYIPAGKGTAPRQTPDAKALRAEAWSSCPSSILPLRVKFPHIFPRQPLIFVGTAASAKGETGQRLARLQVDGLALIPFDQS